MTNYQTALPAVFELARKVQETGRGKDMSRIFTGTPDEIGSYSENVRCAIDSLNDAVCAIGDLLTGHSAIEADKVERLGWLLTMIGEMQNVLGGEAFALSERTDR
jgi:hypothetical protein